MLVARRRGRLNQKNVATADVLLDHHIGFTVRKRTDRRLAKRYADVFADSLGQFAIGRATEDFHFRLASKHEGLNCRAPSLLAMIKTCQKRTLSRLVPASMNADAIR